MKKTDTSGITSLDLLKNGLVELPKQISNWIIAGAGNFQNSIESSYRRNCGKYKYKKLIRCNKFDCSECFLATAHERALEISYNLKYFKKENLKNIPDDLQHIIISPKKEKIFPYLMNYKKFLYFRKKEIYPKIKEMGLIIGTVFFHLWSVHCKRCKKAEPDCKCKNPKYFWYPHPHFHIIGFGKLKPLTISKIQKAEFIIINAKERENIFATVYYILSHIAIWKGNKRKRPKAYEYFGLRNNFT